MNRLIYRGLYLFHWGWLRLIRYFSPLGLGVWGCLMVSGVVGLWSLQSMSHLVFFLCLTLLAIAALTRQWSQYSVKLRRSLPRFGTVGELLQYSVEVQNLTAVFQPSLYLSEEIPSIFPGFTDFLQFKRRFRWRREWIYQWPHYVAQQQEAIAPLKALPPLKPRSKLEVVGEVLPLKRGRLRLPAMAVSCLDPLGLSYRRQIYHQAQSLCILPRPYQLPSLSWGVRQSRQSGERVLTAMVGESLEFRSLRDYRPGDPTNKIHWKSWAKVGRPIVREQQDESALRYGLIVDTLCDGEGEVFEEILALATSVLIQDPMEAAVLEVLFASGDQIQCQSVGQGLRLRSPLLENLATLSPHQRLDWNAFVPLIQSHLPRLSGCLCILGGWEEDRAHLVEQLAYLKIPTHAWVVSQEWMSLDGIKEQFLPHCQMNFLLCGQIQEDLLR